MKKIIFFIIFGVFILFHAYPAYAKSPLSYREDKKISPSYGMGKFDNTQRSSAYIASLINKGKIDKAAQILGIYGPQKAATVLLTMKLRDAQRLLSSLDTKNAASVFVRLSKLDAGYGGKLLAATSQTNSSLAAVLYNNIAEEKDVSDAILRTAADKKMLSSLLSAKDKKAAYIIPADAAHNLLQDYAGVNERQEWGSVEIAALINSGRGAEILFLKLTQQSVLEMSNEEKMKVLLSMKLEEAAKIIKNAYPEQAAQLLLLMKPRQAALILAQKVIKSEKVKIIIREMDKEDFDKTDDMLNELEILAPGKVIAKSGLGF